MLSFYIIHLKNAQTIPQFLRGNISIQSKFPTTTFPQRSENGKPIINSHMPDFTQKANPLSYHKSLQPYQLHLQNNGSSTSITGERPPLRKLIAPFKTAFFFLPRAHYSLFYFTSFNLYFPRLPFYFPFRLTSIVRGF